MAAVLRAGGNDGWKKNELRLTKSIRTNIASVESEYGIQNLLRMLLADLKVFFQLTGNLIFQIILGYVLTNDSNVVSMLSHKWCQEECVREEAFGERYFQRISENFLFSSTDQVVEQEMKIKDWNSTFVLIKIVLMPSTNFLKNYLRLFVSVTESSFI